MVRVGPPLVICKVLFGSPSRAERSKRERPCRSSINSIAKVTIGHVFFSTPMRRDTRLDTDVQRISGFIRMKTVPRLHLAVNEKKPKMVPTANKRSVKSSCRVLHKHLPRYKLSDRKLLKSNCVESYVQLF